MLTEKEATTICNNINNMFPHLQAFLRQMREDSYWVEVLNLKKSGNDFIIRYLNKAKLELYFGRNAGKILGKGS
jgi:hypothetical protein